MPMGCCWLPTRAFCACCRLSSAIRRSQSSAFFVQPGFAALAAQSDVDVGDGYRGQLTIGDQAGKTRTLRGHVWRRATEIRLLAEYDIAELEKLYESMLALSRDSLLREHAAAQANVDLRHRRANFSRHRSRLAHRCWQSAQARAGFGNRDQPCATQWRLGLRDYGRYRSVQACQRCIRHGAGDSVLIRFSALLMSTTRQLTS